MNVKCPSCGIILELEGEFDPGQLVGCPSCNKEFMLSEGSSEALSDTVAQEVTTDEPALESDGEGDKCDADEGDELAQNVVESTSDDIIETSSSTVDQDGVTDESALEADIDGEETHINEGDKLVQNAVETVEEVLKTEIEASKGPEKEEKKALRGKIYEDSVSLYDDEARVAFDYFRKAAERIVAEEDSVTEKRVKAEADIVELKKEVEAADAEYDCALKDAKNAKLWFFGFILIIPIFVAISKLLKAKKRRLAAEAQQKAVAEKMAAAENILAKIKNDFENIKRDYTISKLGVAYVPVATEVPFEDKSFILDDTKKTANSTFELYQVKAQDEFVGTLTSIKKREETVPIVETGMAPEAIPASELVPSFDSVWMNDYLGGLDRDLRAMAYFLRDLKKTSVTLPIIAPQGEYAKFLEEYCTSETGDMPVLNVFDNSSYSEDLEKFEAINEMKKKMTFSNESLDDVLQNFISEIAENVQYVGRAKIASIAKVLSACGETLLNSFKASYNHYSPEVAKDEIERLQQEDFSYRSNDMTGIKPFILSSGSRVRYDAVSANWVADDGARVSEPLGIHQIQEEIISPLVQNLLRETRIERLKIYNNIVDQKLNYVKEWQKEVDDFYGRGRAEGNDIINQIQVTLGEFTTAYSQYEAFRQTEKAVAGGDDSAPQNMKLAEGTSEKNVLAFKEQADHIDAQMEEFNRYVEDLQGDIERRAGEFSYTEDYEASLRDRHSKDAVMSLKAIDNLEERRKMLLAANPYIAENAKLPPEATVNSDELYGRLGKDLCATAANLVDAIGAELRDEAQAAKENEEDTLTSDSLENEHSSDNEVSGVEEESSTDGESVESDENGDKAAESNSDDEKAAVDAEDDKDESDEESVSTSESDEESEDDEESEEDVLDDDDELDDDSDDDELDDEDDLDDDELDDEDDLDDDELDDDDDLDDDELDDEDDSDDESDDDEDKED